MAKPFSRESAVSLEPLKVLFVSVNEDDTSFLTKDVPIKVVHASTISCAKTELPQEQCDALGIDLADPGAERFPNSASLVDLTKSVNRCTELNHQYE